MPNPFGTEEFVQFTQIQISNTFSRWEVVKSVWIMQVFGLLMVRFRQVSLYLKM